MPASATKTQKGPWAKEVAVATSVATVVVRVSVETVVVEDSLNAVSVSV